MFLYWDGYEIDGSDTDFNIVLPESVQMSELAECFLKLPLFDKGHKPDFTVFKGNKCKHITYKEWKNLLLGGSFSALEITVNCLHPEELPEALRSEIYAQSCRREPREEAWGKVEKPCTPPVRQKGYTRGNMTVNFCIGKETVGPEEELDGYITNQELILDGKKDLPCVQLNVGPGFYYEYAMYIVDSLRASFPSVATFGGLDCEGGWTYGCTYADSLYAYEKIDIPVRYSVRNTLKGLCGVDVLMPCVWYYDYKKGWVADCSGDFVLEKGIPSYLVKKGVKDIGRLSFGDYAGLVEQTLESPVPVFDMICDTAMRVKLPEPEHFTACRGTVEKLKRLYQECGVQGGWSDLGYFCFYRQEGLSFCQFRVPYQKKAYLLGLLELMESGALDDMKPEVYRRRHEADGQS